jgi:hypothetical protein
MLYTPFGRPSRHCVVREPHPDQGESNGFWYWYWISDADEELSVADQLAHTVPHSSGFQHWILTVGGVVSEGRLTETAFVTVVFAPSSSVTVRVTM